LRRRSFLAGFLALSLATAALAAEGPSAGAGPGFLFSTIPCAETPLGREWARLREEAERRFPALAMTRAEDLHLTLVYVGAWRQQDLERLRALTHLVPGEPAVLSPSVAALGRERQVIAVDLGAAPAGWAEAVVAAKAELVRLKLKAPDRYDGSFRPHVSLAAARHRPPTAADRRALGAFRRWLEKRIAADPARFTVAVGPESPVRLWVAGTSRPPGAPAYVAVEELLAAPAAPR
jgi:2'-5' RNA ligase